MDQRVSDGTVPYLFSLFFFLSLGLLRDFASPPPRTFPAIFFVFLLKLVFPFKTRRLIRLPPPPLVRVAHTLPDLSFFRRFRTGLSLLFSRHGNKNSTSLLLPLEAMPFYKVPPSLPVCQYCFCIFILSFSPDFQSTDLSVRKAQLFQYSVFLPSPNEFSRRFRVCYPSSWEFRTFLTQSVFIPVDLFVLLSLLQLLSC